MTLHVVTFTTGAHNDLHDTCMKWASWQAHIMTSTKGVYHDLHDRYSSWPSRQVHVCALFQRQRRNVWETRWSAYVLFRAHRHYVEQSWTTWSVYPCWKENERGRRSVSAQQVWYEKHEPSVPYLEWLKSIRETDIQTDRQTDRQTQRQRETERQRQTERHRETETETERDRNSDRETQSEREGQKQRQRDTETQSGREGQRGGEGRKRLFLFVLLSSEGGNGPWGRYIKWASLPAIQQLTKITCWTVGSFRRFAFAIVCSGLFTMHGRDEN